MPDSRPTESETRCPKCDRSFPLGTQRCSTCNVFLAGNRAAMTHGLSKQMRGQLPVSFASEVAEREAAMLTDLGGDVSTIKRAYIKRAAELEVMADSIGAQLVVLGITTPKGRVRSLYTAYLSCVGAWERLVRQLGLEREPKRLPNTIESWMREQSGGDE